MNPEFESTLLAFIITIVLGASLFVGGQYLSDISDNCEHEPEQVELVAGEHFEMELVFEVRRGCRYDLYSIQDDKRTKVGYIRSHCDYDNGKNYLLSSPPSR